MPLSTKENVTKYKERKKELALEDQRINFKAKKDRPYKIMGSLTYTSPVHTICLGRYATLKDALKADKVFKKTYYNVEIINDES